MGMNEERDVVEFVDKGFKRLMKAIEDIEDNTVAVGVLGQKNQRAGATETNANIGMKHEFGEVVEINGRPVKLPERSWLRMPITEKLVETLVSSGAFTEDAARKVVDDGTVVPWLKKIGIAAEAVIADAFNTGGFGKWPASNMNFKKNHQTLVETQQLRNSVLSEVREKK